MKKITKTKFIKLFVPSKELLDENGCVATLLSDQVAEFKIGNKYIYKLTNNPYLLSAHDNLCEYLLNDIPVNNSATAYRKGISYLNLFEPHRAGYYFMRIDISSFFHSIRDSLLREGFSNCFHDEYIDDNENESLLDGFIRLVTYVVPEISSNERFRNKSILPIGFKTSPVISNIIFRKLDILIQKFCVSKNITYTRYADDMLFSSDKSSKYIHSDSFFNEIKYMLSIDGFKINKRKTIKKNHTISLNGYTLSNDALNENIAFIRISNKKTKIIEKLLHCLDKKESNLGILSKLFGFRVSPKYFKYFPPKQEYIDKYCYNQVLNKITGYRSFLISIIKFQENYNCVTKSSIDKYKQLIERLNMYIIKMNAAL